MNIIVCVKQVPDTAEVRLDPKTGTLIRDGVPSIINPDDKNALEAAIRLKEENENVKVTVVSMGPPQADVALREALAMGADEAILLSDRAFSGSDTWATGHILAEAIKEIKDYDIIFCGRQAIDGDTAQVGPQIAEQLGLPQITYVQDIKLDGDRLIAKSALEDGYRVLETKMPCLLTVIKELNEPRYPSMRGIFDAYSEKNVEVFTNKKLGIDTANIGLAGSPTNVYKTFTPSQKGVGRMLTGADKGAVAELFTELREKHVL